MSWTPGPWYATDEYGCIQGPNGETVVDANEISPIPHNANRALIRAAPEMADLLEHMANQLEGEVKSEWTGTRGIIGEGQFLQNSVDKVRTLLARIQGDA